MRYVLAVAELGSFTRAAEQCFVVQSALSHQVKALERELGVTLFARTSRRVELTPAGAAFLPEARRSVEAAERAAADAAAAAGEVRGRLTIGMIPTVTAVDVPALLELFHREYPQVRIELRGGGSGELAAGVRAGAVDVALLGLPAPDEPAGVQHQVLESRRLVAAVGATHRLAGRDVVRLQDLADETFADFPAATPGREQSDRAFDAAGLRREVAFESMSPELLLGLVARSLAVALLPEGVVPADGRFSTMEVSDGPTRIEYLAWSEFNPSPAARAFVASARAAGVHA